MKSAGNDIVALNAVYPQRSISPNFYSKFIVPAEREIFEQSSALKTVSFCSFVWLLWSVKESAYKYFKRLQPELVFSPSKFVVEGIVAANDGHLKGTVSFQDQTLFFRSQITENHLSTIVNDEEPFEGVYHEVQKIEKKDSETQSDAVRKLALTTLHAVLKTDGLIISTSGTGYPVIVKDGKPLDIALSFAHHGCFVGYSFKI